MNQLRILPCLDSDELALTRKKELAILPELAESLGRSAVEAIELGYYHTDRGKVEWSELVQAARECERPAAARQSSAGALLHRSPVDCYLHKGVCSGGLALPHEDSAGRFQSAARLRRAGWRGGEDFADWRGERFWGDFWS